MSGITDAMARAKNKAWPSFKFWLQAKSINELAAADAGLVAELYPPLDEAEVRQMIDIRLRTMRRCKAAGKEPPPIV